jgi:hypothetical protein
MTARQRKRCQDRITLTKRWGHFTKINDAGRRVLVQWNMRSRRAKA